MEEKEAYKKNHNSQEDILSLPQSRRAWERSGIDDILGEKEKCGKDNVYYAVTEWCLLLWYHSKARTKTSE